MEFKSQICTTIEQSIRLLTVGLKPETADMYLEKCSLPEAGEYYIHALTKDINPKDWFYARTNRDIIPAWSLGRLIEMMPDKIKFHEFTEEFIIREKIPLYIAFDDNKKLIYYSHHLGIPTGNIFDDLVKTITGLISHGNFNKEYLNNNIK